MHAQTHRKHTRFTGNLQEDQYYEEVLGDKERWPDFKQVMFIMVTILFWHLAC